jgi:hypothetical protein
VVAAVDRSGDPHSSVHYQSISLSCLLSVRSEWDIINLLSVLAALPPAAPIVGSFWGAWSAMGAWGLAWVQAAAGVSGGDAGALVRANRRRAHRSSASTPQRSIGGD